MASPSKRRKGICDASSGIELLGEDLLHNILSRLPAESFASAACINRSWNRICNRILSRPKLLSAISTIGSLEVDVAKVLERVLQEPIRPHFAIVYVSRLYSLTTVQQLISQKLGSNTVIVTSEAKGIMGTDCSLNTYEEIKWTMFNQWQIESSSFLDVKYGIMLAVGYVPGLKVKAIPLRYAEITKDDRWFTRNSCIGDKVPLIDEFLIDIKNYIGSVSNNASPAGIIMFGARGAEMKPALSKMNYAMPLETPIIGDENCRFIYKVKSNSRSYLKDYDGVALVFARDKDRPHGIGEIEFHVSPSPGLSAVGPIYKVVYVKESMFCTWLNARREGHAELLGGCRLINDICNEVSVSIKYPVLHIGVTKRRKHTLGLGDVNWVTSLEFHKVSGGNGKHLFLDGTGIKSSDTFQFYYSDPSAALASCRALSETLRLKKLEWGSSSRNKKEAFGGFIFSGYDHGINFFQRLNLFSARIDSSPILDNFPEIPLCGTFCSGGQITRTSSTCYLKPGDEETGEPLPIILHAYSAAYLVLTYTIQPFKE